MGGPLLEPPDIKIIFGNIPPIYEVHCKLRDDLAGMAGRWRDELSVGEAVIKYVSARRRGGWGRCEVGECRERRGGRSGSGEGEVGVDGE